MFAIERGGEEQNVEKGSMEMLPQEKKLVYHGPELSLVFHWVSQM